MLAQPRNGDSWQIARAIAWATVAGLGRVRQDKRTGRWYIDLRPHARVFTYLAPWGSEAPFPDERSADRTLERIREWCSEGMTPLAAIERIRPRSGSLVSSKAQEWIAAKWKQVESGEKVARSIRELELSVRREWGYWDGISIFDVRAKHLGEWATALAAKGLRPHTVRAELARFHSFFAWLKGREDIAAIPPFPTVKAPRVARPTLTWEQQDAVIAQIEERWQGIFLAMATLALRPQEARAMLVRDIGAESVQIRRAAKDEGPRAPVGGTKTGVERTLPLPPRLAAWASVHHANLTDEQRMSALAFPAPTGRMWGQHALREWWQKASRAAGVPVVPVRDAMRHSTAQEWRRRLNAPVSDIRDALGHTSEATTRIYLGAASGQLVSMVSARRKREPKS